MWGCREHCREIGYQGIRLFVKELIVVHLTQECP
jgi:hypothetical protein